MIRINFSHLSMRLNNIYSRDKELLTVLNIKILIIHDENRDSRSSLM